MNETDKSVIVDEPDPKRLEERQHDEPGSFLDLYRSLNVSQVTENLFFVDNSVREGVVPEQVRFGAMHRGNMHAYRGVVKSTSGDLFYFSWHDGAPFKLVPADTPTKQWEASKLLKACEMGCDLIRSGSGNPVDEGPIDPGTSIEEDDEEDVDRGGGLPGATGVVTEQTWMNDQDRLMHEVHPGAAGTQTTDDPTRGRDWHAEPVARALDALPPLAQNDGEKHWTAVNLVKAWGTRLQETAPRVAPPVTSLEAEYMETVLGVTSEQITKGVRLPPRHRLGFEQWKASRLRSRLSGLQSWTGNGKT